MSHAVAPEFVRDNLSGYATRFQKMLEETLGSLGVSSLL